VIKTIQPFIDLNWHTVPLKGELKRQSNGKKTLPIFDKNWREIYSKERNTKDSPLGGVLTGKLSNIIAIDCDNAITFSLFQSLDPNYNFRFMSKGKTDSNGNEKICGTIIYKYPEEELENFIVKNNVIELDFYANGGFVYLPTEANETKHDFELCELKQPPAEVIALLKSIQPVVLTRDEAKLEDKMWSYNLAPQVRSFLAKKKVDPKLFGFLTPKDFRDIQEYKAKGYLHPEEVPEGRGSEYLSKVSAILGADNSIDIELYYECMELINEMFEEPMLKKRLQTTILDPMAEERANIDGKPIWQYDENWQDGKLQLLTKRNEVVDLFFDPQRCSYYFADIFRGRVKQFERPDDFAAYIATTCVEAPPKKAMQSLVPLVDVVSTPAKDFGFFIKNEETAFNSFYPTEALQVFKEPLTHKSKYSKPTYILNFLKSLIPDNYNRNYLLKFIKRKLTYFDYSPTVLYFLGVPGAGKDTFVHLMEKIIGGPSLARPTVKEFLEKYNNYLLDTYFVQLDEYGNQLTKFDEKENVIGKIKAYTGKPEVSIRKMRTDPFQYEHRVTFIMTANKNPLFIEGEDRRFALFNCPNVLKDELWVQEAGGLSLIHKQMDKEIVDFCYYLATEVEMLSADAYQTPPNTEDKKRLIASKFGAAQKIAFLLANRMFKDFEELCTTHDLPNVLSTAAEGKLHESDLFDLYYEMTEGKGTKRGLTVGMKDFNKVPTTRNGQKAYFYEIAGLMKYSVE
jgi:hypothetical protein